MKSEWVAGLGGLVIGHILWLLGISLAIATADINFWVLVVSAAIVVLSVVAAMLGWRRYKVKSHAWAAFLLCLPISPILFTIAVLGATYL